jgi:hypothetical protein
MLNEKLNVFGWVGCGLCINGSVTIVLHAPAERPLNSVLEVWEMAMQPGAGARRRRRARGGGSGGSGGAPSCSLPTALCSPRTLPLPSCPHPQPHSHPTPPHPTPPHPTPPPRSLPAVRLHRRRGHRVPDILGRPQARHYQHFRVPGDMLHRGQLVSHQLQGGRLAAGEAAAGAGGFLAAGLARNCQAAAGPAEARLWRRRRLVVAQPAARTAHDRRRWASRSS